MDFEDWMAAQGTSEASLRNTPVRLTARLQKRKAV